jgi:hypothetical protein
LRGNAFLKQDQQVFGLLGGIMLRLPPPPVPVPLAGLTHGST